jgi:fermentation-respiration switch protein FrsA (DUF1100 family)
MIFALKGLVVLALLVALGVVGTRVLQQRLLYMPDTQRTLPIEADLPEVVERELIMADGEKIVTWWGKAQPGCPTLLYVHGNGGSLVTRSERIRKYMAHGYGIVMMTYRGFGGSTGRPTETANVSDAKEVYEAVRASGIPARDIVIYGESLGTGVAVQVVAEKAVGGVILDAPYTSIVDLATLHYPYLPARWLMTDRYETLRFAARVKAPVLIVHGEADDIIPVAMSRQVAAALTGPVQVATFAGAGHSDHYLFGSYETIYAWLQAHWPNASIGQVRPASQ